MINILHVVSDDKFIEDAKNVMDSVPNTSNKFVCPVDNEREYVPKFIKSEDVDIISLNMLKKILYDETIDIVAFHVLPFWMYDYVLSIPKSVKIWWLVWGYDIYIDTSGYEMQPIIPLKLYKPLTKSFVKAQLLSTPNILQNVQKMFKVLVNYKGNRDREMKRLKKIWTIKELRQTVLESVDFVSTVLPVEYEMLAKIKGFNAKYIPFQYPFITKETQSCKSPDASYILLGNSSDCTNNHLDIIEIIRKRKINNKVYVPLTYGDPEYKKYVKEHLENYENILIQNDFVSREEYMSILSNCKVAVFGHIRQQALGNIAMAMMLGMKVFLFKKSVCYKYLKSKGYKVFSIEKDLTQKTIDQPLPKKIEDNNRVMIMEMFSYDTVRRAVSAFFRKEEIIMKSSS